MVELRLSSYGLFSKKTLADISRFARAQDSFKTYQDFFASVAMPEPTLFVTPEGRGAPYNFSEQNLSFLDRLKLAFTSDLRPLVAADLAYLQKTHAKNVTVIGYSFGALRALIAWEYATKLDVHRVVLIDPVTHPRLPHTLLKDFKSTMEPLEMYAGRTESKKFKQARDATSAELQYNEGLRRGVNLAIGVMLARVNFITKLKKKMKASPGVSVVVHQSLNTQH